MNLMSRCDAHQLLGRLARKEKLLDVEVSFSELATQGLPNSIWYLNIYSLILLHISWIEKS